MFVVSTPETHHEPDISNQGDKTIFTGATGAL
jgi:hypothetical protein